MTVFTIRARIPGLQIDRDITIGAVKLWKRKTCISLSTTAISSSSASLFLAEERLQHIAQAIELLHHQIKALCIDKKRFPVRHSSRFISEGQQLSSLDIQIAATSLANNPKTGVLKSILKVMSRADEGETWLEQFILKWMAFNGLYGMLSIDPNEKERKQIEQFITRSSLTDAELRPWIDKRITQQGFSSLASANLTVGLGSSPMRISMELSNALTTLSNTGDYRGFASTAIMAVYAVRNRFFHGNAPAVQTTQIPEVDESVFFLDFIIRAAIQKQLGLLPTGSSSRLVEQRTIAFDETVSVI